MIGADLYGLPFTVIFHGDKIARRKEHGTR
jgi:hypothetical protein